MKKLDFMTLLLKKIKSVSKISLTIAREAVFGEVNRLPTEPKVVGSVVHPENKPSLNEWLVEFKIGVALPKQVVVTKQQIGEMFGVNSTELIII